MAQNPAFVSDADFCDKTVSYCVNPSELPFSTNITIVETPASPVNDENVKVRVTLHVQILYATSLL